jgi:quinol monooxygenase YgiN
MAKRKAGKRAVRPRKTKPASGAKLPKNAVTLIVQLRPRDGQEMLLEAELRALVAPSGKEDGCLLYNLYRSAEPPIAFLLHEVWASREAYSVHTKTPHFLRWNARKDALIASRESSFWQQIT